MQELTLFKTNWSEDVLYIFEEEDDAVRYAMMLEDKGLS